MVLNSSFCSIIAQAIKQNELGRGRPNLVEYDLWLFWLVAINLTLNVILKIGGSARGGEIEWKRLIYNYHSLGDCLSTLLGQVQIKKQIDHFGVKSNSLGHKQILENHGMLCINTKYFSWMLKERKKWNEW